MKQAGIALQVQVRQRHRLQIEEERNMKQNPQIFGYLSALVTCSLSI